MDLKTFNSQFSDKMNELNKFVQSDDIKDIMGAEAIAVFQENFAEEGFIGDNGVKKWDDVKRRDPASDWYGHSGQTGKFSAARTTAKILTGETNELQNAFSYDKTATGAIIRNSAIYAAVHQFGLQAKIYGKKAFQMIARPFMGKSEKLKENIENKIVFEIKKILEP